MIERLRLQRFGRFIGREFTFGPSVIFFGPNESGKTTIFDALFTALCRVPRQGVYKTDIYQRYGDAMEAEVVPEECAEAFELGEFKDLHSIRSGDVSLSFGDSSSWAAGVKRALFSGGLDPLAVADELAQLASDKTTVKHNKEIAARRARRAELVAARERLEADRAAHVAQTRSGEDLTVRLQQIDEAVRACDVTIGTLTADILREERIAERRGLDESFAQLDREQRLRETLEHMTGSPAEELADLSACENTVARLTAERDTLRDAAASRARELEEREAGREASEAQQRSADPLARKADVLAGRIMEFLGDPARRMTVVTVWHVPLAAASGLIAAAALIAGIVVHPLWLIGLIALGGLFFARRASSIEDGAAMNRVRTEVRDEYRNSGGGELRSDSLQGIADELRAVVAARDHLSEELQRSSADIARAREAVTSAQNKVRDVESALAEAERACANVLQRAGVTGKDALLKRIAGKKAAEEQLAAVGADLRKRMTTLGFTDRETFLRDVRRKLADADREGVPTEGLMPAAVQKLRGQLAAAQQKKRDLESSRADLKEQRGRAAGMTTALGPVLENLVENEREIARLDAEIADLELNKKGAALAAELFRAMAADAGVMLAALAAEMENVFRGLVAVPRAVSVDAFDSERIQAMDAGGVMRGISHLSKGTRDTLTFAARLTLALKADPDEKKRLLVLDEPFTSLDPGRTASALAMVRRIQDDHGWQVVLFTKDPDLADAAVRALREPVRHDLTP